MSPVVSLSVSRPQSQLTSQQKVRETLPHLQGPLDIQLVDGGIHLKRAGLLSLACGRGDSERGDRRELTVLRVFRAWIVALRGFRR